MTTEEAAQKLKDMYNKGLENGKATTGLQLFGIIYANEIAHLRIPDIVERSGLNPRSHGRWLSDGVKLAEYVQVVKDFP